MRPRNKHACKVPHHSLYSANKDWLVMNETLPVIEDATPAVQAPATQAPAQGSAQVSAQGSAQAPVQGSAQTSAREPAPEPTRAAAARIGVLLVNLGTPDAADAPAVRRYLEEFLTDPRVI